MVKDFRLCAGSYIVASYEREVRDLPWSAYRTAAVVALYRVRCPDCRVKGQKALLLLSKAPFSRRFEDEVDEVDEASESAAVWSGDHGKALDAFTFLSRSQSLMAYP